MDEGRTLEEMIKAVAKLDYIPPAKIGKRIYDDCTQMWAAARVKGNDKEAYLQTRRLFDMSVATRKSEHYSRIANIFAEHKKQDYEF